MINNSQKQLVLLEISQKELDKVVSICKQRGLCTKLTGAGGGGCAFSLITPG